MAGETVFLLLLVSTVVSSRAKTRQGHDPSNKETAVLKQDKLSALACFSSVLENGCGKLHLL